MRNRSWRLDGGSWMLNFQIFILCFGLLSLVISQISCNSKSSDKEVKFRQYFVQGEQLYQQHCSNCHQSNGTGLGLVYPPLNKSDFMDTRFEEVICMMKYGRNDELIVNGKSYIQPMPGVVSLTDIEIAEIATYIYNSWDHHKGLIEVSAVSKIMSNCKEDANNN